MSNDFKGRQWGIARARSGLSELLETAAREPQHLYNRGRRVGVVIGPEEYERYEQWKREQRTPPLAHAFDDLRRLCRDEQYELVMAPRIDRPNPFAPFEDDEHDPAD